MKQTAVEWLYKNLLENPISNEDVEYNEAVFHNAKEMEKQQKDEFALDFLHWYNTSQECETYLRRNYPKNITMGGEHHKKVLEVYKELLEIYKKEKGL